MPVDFSNTLVVGISSRALFDLDTENQVYDEQGLEVFRRHQRTTESHLLKPGTSFPLVKALLRLNQSESAGRKVEVILMSRKHPDVALRVFNSIQSHGLDITRAALTGGNPVAPYLAPFQVDLFLSKDESDVCKAIESGVPAGVIYRVPERNFEELDHVRIAFDGDCVLFSDEAQLLFDQHGIEAFHANEALNADKPLGEGPFAKLLKTIALNQAVPPTKSPFHIALVTARNAPSHKRAIKTLEHWGVRIDEAFFLGGLPKEGVLAQFRPHIFFDDQAEYCERASTVVATARVPREMSVPKAVTVKLEQVRGEFVMVCKIFLGKEYETQEQEIEEFYSERMVKLDELRQESFLDELRASTSNTPVGHQRRAGSASDTKAAKLMQFLDNLFTKHRG